MGQLDTHQFMSHAKLAIKGAILTKSLDNTKRPDRMVTEYFSDMIQQLNACRPMKTTSVCQGHLQLTLSTNHTVKSHSRNTIAVVLHPQPNVIEVGLELNNQTMIMSVSENNLVRLRTNLFDLCINSPVQFKYRSTRPEELAMKTLEFAQRIAIQYGNATYQSLPKVKIE